jgi:hypothetical protein
VREVCGLGIWGGGIAGKLEDGGIVRNVGIEGGWRRKIGTVVTSGKFEGVS